MHMIFKNKTLEYGVGTFLPNTAKNVFRQDLINQDLEMLWTELEINGKRVLNIVQISAEQCFYSTKQDLPSTCAQQIPGKPQR